MCTKSIATFIGLNLVFLCDVHAGDYLIQNARMFENSQSSPTVNILIKGEKIAAIGANVSGTADTVLIDAAGKFVTPALMNSATELGLIEMHSVKETVDSGGSADGFGAAFDVQYGLNPNSALLGIARSEGLARAVVLPSGADSSHFAGLGALIQLKENSNILDRAQALLAVHTGSTGSSSSSRSAAWVALRQEFEEAKVDFEEFKSGTDDLDDDEKILHDVLIKEIPLVIKASRESDIAQAIALSKDYNIRIVIVGGEEAWRLAPELAAAKVAVIIVPYANLPSVYDSLGTRADNAKILHENGVMIGFSVDSIFVSHNAGNAMRVGAGIAAGHGLPKQAALDAMTKNPAKIWGISEAYGTLEKGKTADIVIWSGDPLEALTWPEKVMINGELVTAISRHQALRDKYLPYIENTTSPIHKKQ